MKATVIRSSFLALFLINSEGALGAEHLFGAFCYPDTLIAACLKSFQISLLVIVVSMALSPFPDTDRRRGGR